MKLNLYIAVGVSGILTGFCLLFLGGIGNIGFGVVLILLGIFNIVIGSLKTEKQ